jgi:hypothetical protein
MNADVCYNTIIIWLKLSAAAGFIGGRVCDFVTWLLKWDQYERRRLYGDCVCTKPKETHANRQRSRYQAWIWSGYLSEAIRMSSYFKFSNSILT